MEVLILLVFCSLALVAGAVGLFAWSLQQRTLDHADRLALLPLDETASSHENPQPHEQGD